MDPTFSKRNEKEFGMLRSINVTYIPDARELGRFQIVSFTDDDKGVKAAEAMFKELALNGGCDIEEIEECLDNGFFEHCITGFYVAIVHSTPYIATEPIGDPTGFTILFKGAATGEMGVRLWDVLKKQPDATVSYKKSHYWTYRYGRDCTNEIDLIKKMDFIKQIRLL